MSKIKVKISETKFLSFYKTLTLHQKSFAGHEYNLKIFVATQCKENMMRHSTKMDTVKVSKMETTGDQIIKPVYTQVVMHESRSGGVINCKIIK